jgi:hypothetical protein
MKSGAALPDKPLQRSVADGRLCSEGMPAPALIRFEV